MNDAGLIKSLEALTNEHRLRIIRLLGKHNEEGMAAGEIAKNLAVPATTLSPHFAVLTAAGIVKSKRNGRNIIYRIDLDAGRKIGTAVTRDVFGG